MARLKINYPSYQQPRLVTYGTGSLKTLAAAGSLDETAFFLSGADAVADVLEKVLGKQGYDTSELAVVRKGPGEPTVEMIDEGTSFLQRRGFQRIVGVGGGSVLDWCRLAWAHGAGLLDLETGRVTVQGDGERDGSMRRPEFWLIPTTCATGAEAAAVAVYERDGEKVPVVSPSFLADHVVLDAQFLIHLSERQIARSLCDALSHGIEAFLSIVPAHLAKENGVAAIRLILEHYGDEPGSCRNERLLEAAYLGGVAASNCSVGVVHAFAHTMARFHVGHGHGNALGLPAGTRANADTPAMRSLLDRLGAVDTDDFTARILPIVRQAIDREEDRRLIDVLRENRRSIQEAMAGDVCLRSNPQRLDTEALDTFLETVIETIHQA